MSDDNSLPPIERLQAVRIEPGDTIIATVPRDTSDEQAKVIREDLRVHFPGHDVLIVVGVQLTVGRVAEETE